MLAWEILDISPEFFELPDFVSKKILGKRRYSMNDNLQNYKIGINTDLSAKNLKFEISPRNYSPTKRYKIYEYRSN